MDTSSPVNQAPLPQISLLAPFSPMVHPFPPPGKVNRIPVEILSEIFLIVMEDWHREHEYWVLLYQRALMLVCRHWYAVMLSTPGVRSTLRIRRATQKEVVQTILQERTRSLMDVIVDMNDAEDGNDFNADSFHACFMAAAQAASRWRSLKLISPPPHGEFNGLQILQPLKQLECFKLAQGFGMFVDLLMTAIRTATPYFTTMELADPVAVPFIVQPACLHIFHSLVTLKIRLSKKMDSPVDVLPHLQRLKTFVAHHLCLPIYPPDVSLPLIRVLELKSVSVQWMAGHIFPHLEKCSIIFPHHAGAIQALQAVTMPNCFDLVYTSNDLSPLKHFHLPSLYRVNVKSGQWSAWRGNPQLVAVHHILAASAQSLERLSLDVLCSEELLVYVLRLLPNLKSLWLGLASPHALSEAFFQAFILESEVVQLPRKTIAPLCTSLQELRLHYRRWLRGPDKRSHLLAFAAIEKSRDLVHDDSSEERFELQLSFEEAPKGCHWSIIGRVFNALQGHETISIDLYGVSSSYDTITMTTTWSGSGPIPLPFKEEESLYLENHYDGPIEPVYALDHMELMRYDSDQQRLPTPPHNLPLFHVLKRLELRQINPSFLAGHTFHKLEGCRVVTRHESDEIPDHGLFTEMPVCTKLDINDLTFLSTFKLPHIQELGVEFRDLKCNPIWEKQIAVNTNLSGLKLLHLKRWHFHGNLDQILRPLPLLNTLVLSFPPDMECFGSLLPLSANEASELKQSSSEGRSPVVFCPELQSLQIEGADPSEVPSLIPILKELVIGRALFGSPLKTFTFSPFRNNYGSKFELIGSDGSFTMENCVLDAYCRGFELDI
jgi:hypothetical protein